MHLSAALGLIGRGGASFLLFPHPHPSLIITLPPISLLPGCPQHIIIIIIIIFFIPSAEVVYK